MYVFVFLVDVNIELSTAYCNVNINKNQRSLRDSTIFHGVCVGEMLVLKAICDALKPIDSQSRRL